MILSIIVPVYNVEPYVYKCLDSLEHQNLPKDQYEILVLNDGSTDNGGEIARNFCKSHSQNFRYLEHANIGLSGTRNRGICNAKGDYIWFVDSDDWIDEDCLYLICSHLKDGNDVLAFNGFIPEGGRVENNCCFNKNVNSKEKLFLEGFADAAQFYIFRKEFLEKNNCFFKEGIKHEDTLFTPIVLHKARKIVFFHTPVYHFLMRVGSITTVVDVKRITDLANNFVELYSYSLKIADVKLRLGFLNHMAHHIIEMLNYGIDNGKKGEKIINEIMGTHPEYWHVLKNALDLKPRLIYWAVKLSPFPFIATYRLMSKLR